MTLEYERVFALDEDALQCPYEQFRQAREQCPVSYADGLGVWVVSDYEQVKTVLHDAVTFSTKYMLGQQVSDQWQQMIDLAAATPEGREQMHADYGQSPRKTLLFADPPDHTQHRRLITRAFSVSAIKSWEPRIKETASMQVDRLAKEPTIEFVGDFAQEYAMTVIADILGLPRDMVPQMLDWAREFNSMVGNPDLGEEKINSLVNTRLTFDQYMTQQMDLRRSDPGTDLISRIVQLNDASDSPLLTDELLMVLQLTLVGGSDTSATALSKMIEYLAETPQQWKELRQDPERIPDFIEEMLRTESPVQGMFRYVTQDVELGGQQLSEGDMVWVSLGSANHDANAFSNPDTKDMSRKGTEKHYVSFGGGPHLCPGAALSRVELRLVLEELTSRFSGVSFTGDKKGSMKTFLFYGPESLNVHFEP